MEPLLEDPLFFNSYIHEEQLQWAKRISLNSRGQLTKEIQELFPECLAHIIANYSLTINEKPDDYHLTSGYLSFDLAYLLSDFNLLCLTEQIRILYWWCPSRAQGASNQEIKDWYSHAPVRTHCKEMEVRIFIGRNREMVSQYSISVCENVMCELIFWLLDHSN